MKLLFPGLFLAAILAQAADPEFPVFEGHASYYFKVKDGSVLQVKTRLSPPEAQEMHDAYARALKEDVSLAAEEASLQQALQNHRLRLKAAMIKADPKIAPLFVPGPGHFAKEPFPAPSGSGP